MSHTPQLNFLKDGDCMSTLMIFIDWARHIKIRKTKEMREIKLTESATTENPSARLDIDMEGTVSRITCWETGDYDAEVIDFDTEKTIYSIHGTLQVGKSMSDQFLQFFEAIGLEVE